MQLNKEFIEQLKELLPDEWEQLVHAIAETEPCVSIRVNEAKGAVIPAGMTIVPWCECGVYLTERQPFTFDVDFKTGRYYVQDASSMFICHVLKSLINAPVRYLDLCAAPGGKTTAAISALPHGSLVVANEIVPKRATVLRENVMKWGSSHCVVSCNAPRDFSNLTHFFDVIAVDAPCSGEGMMRKDAEATAQWSPALVDRCATLQHSIIDDIWPALRPGGLLIYSTCTYNRKENEQILQYIIDRYGAQPMPVPVEPSWNIQDGIGGDACCHRFMPHCTQGEGLFLAVVRKVADEPRKDCLMRRSERTVKKQSKQQLPQGVEDWLHDAASFEFVVQNDTVVARPGCFRQEYSLLQRVLHVLYAGIELGSIKSKSCVPGQALALSQALNVGAFPQCEVDYKTAMAYMRGEAISIDAPRGCVLLMHRFAPIGFVNNLGNRANNLYPKGWRILSSHIPDAEPTVLPPPCNCKK